MYDALRLIGLLALLGGIVFAYHHLPFLLAKGLRGWIRGGDETQSSNMAAASFPPPSEEEETEEEPGSIARTANAVFSVAEAVGALFALGIAFFLLAALVYERFLPHGETYDALRAGQKDATPSMVVLALAFLLMGLRLVRRLAKLPRRPGPVARLALKLSSWRACMLWALAIVGIIAVSYALPRPTRDPAEAELDAFEAEVRARHAEPQAP